MPRKNTTRSTSLLELALEAIHEHEGKCSVQLMAKHISDALARDIEDVKEDLVSCLRRAEVDGLIVKLTTKSYGLPSKKKKNEAEEIVRSSHHA